MKLREKIILLATVPLLILGTIIFFVASAGISRGIYKEAYAGMHATTLAVRSIFEENCAGEYQIKEDGSLWKGDGLNISEATNIVDEIKKNTGMEVTVFFGNTRYLTTIVDAQGKRSIGTTASEEVTDCVLNKGNIYQDDNVMIEGQRYIADYIPYYQQGTTTPVGMIFLGTNYESVQEIVRAEQKELFIITLSVIILTVIIANIIVLSITKALGKGIELVKTIGEGKLGKEIDKKVLTRKDDIGEMCRSIEQLDERLKNTILGIQNESDQVLQSSEELKDSANGVATAITQVDAAVQSIASATTSQAESAVQAGNNVVTMGNLIVDTETEINGMKTSAQQMADSAEHAAATLEELNMNMEQVKRAMQQIEEQTSATHKSVEHISEVTQLITAIASQTNLLSLNASIEAARAGEHGKGFAVVASEIQQLAEQSNKSAEEIQKVLNTLISDSDKTVTVMQDVEQIIEKQEEKIKNTNEVFSTVGAGVHTSISGIEAIAKKSTELEDARTDTTAVVQNVAAVAEENAASTQETAATLDQVSNLVVGVSEHAVNLSNVAEKLQSHVSTFEILSA